MNTPENVSSLSPDVGQLYITRTMLEKSIIDANASIRRLAKLFGIDYETMQAGERVKIPASYLIMQDGSNEGSVTFYKTARGDRRVSIKNIRKQASAGDFVSLSYGKSEENGESIIIINYTRISKALKAGKVVNYV